MNNQDKKFWLSRYQFTLQTVKWLDNDRKQWEDKLAGCAKTLDAPTTPQARDTLQAAVATIMERKEQIVAQIGQAAALAREIEQAIESLEDDRLRLLLRYRYISGWTWERIAVEMGYAYRQVTRLHGKALEEIRIKAKDVLECPT